MDLYYRIKVRLACLLGYHWYSVTSLRQGWVDKNMWVEVTCERCGHTKLIPFKGQ